MFDALGVKVAKPSMVKYAGYSQSCARFSFGMASAYDNPTMFFVAAARGARQAIATGLILADLVGVCGGRHEREWARKGSERKRQALIYEA